MAETHIGVTGTRHPLTDAQYYALCRQLFIIDQARDDQTVLHHGCCTGTDEAAHEFARRSLGWLAEGHPGHGADGRSPWRMTGDLAVRCDVLHKSRRYYLRNRDIAEACSVLVAVPRYPETDLRSARSGTWQAVREARSFSRPVIYVWPDGTETREPESGAEVRRYTT